MLTGDVGRTAILARDDRLDGAELALFHPLKFMLASPAEDAAEILTRLGPDGLGRGQVRRHPLPSSTARARRSASTRATCTTSPASSRRSSTRRATCRGPASSTASSSPGATGRCCRSSRCSRGSGARTRPRRSSPRCRSIFVAWDVLGLDGRRGGAATDRDGVVAPTLELPLDRAPRAARSAGPAARRGGRRLRAVPPQSSAGSIDALEAAFAEARARRNEGLMVKDPTVDLLTRPPRLRLAEDEEGARDDRLRRRRRGGRPRQAPRRPVGLHVRGARRGKRPAGHDRQGVQRA